MYRGFELNLNGWDIATYRAQGIKVFDFFKPKVTSVLDSYIKGNKALDGAKMQEDWFPLVKADIFISHSNTDKDFALCLAGWLYTHFKITAFIDSMIWGYADELLLDIDNRKCKNDQTGNYIYELRNHSTSHIHVMLATALTKMIDKTECFFFINTRNSITIEDSITDPYTYSPWIYSELEMSRLVRKKELSDYRSQVSKVRMFSANEKRMISESVEIIHKVDLEHLTKLSKEDFKVWLQLDAEEKLQYPIGHLYEFRPLEKLKIVLS